MDCPISYGTIYAVCIERSMQYIFHISGENTNKKFRYGLTFSILGCTGVGYRTINIVSFSLRIFRTNFRDYR